MRSKNLTLPCESCGQLNAFPHPYIVNVAKEPALKQAIMNDDIFKYECAFCHHVTYYYHSLIYFDPQHKLFICYCENQEEFSHLMALQFLGDHLRDYIIRYCDNYFAFKEKIQIFDHQRDDRLIAIYKDMLLNEFKKTYPDCGRALAYYDSSSQESIVVISDHYGVKCYSFSESWYQSHAANAMLTHVLHYDTSPLIDEHYVKQLYGLNIPIILVRVMVMGQMIDYVVNANDHVHVGDHVEVIYHGEKAIGTISTIHTKEVRDVPHGTKFIQKVIPFVPPYERAAQVAVEHALTDIHGDHQTMQVGAFFQLLENCIVYLPLKDKDGLLMPETMEDRDDALSFIPIFTNHDEIISFYDEHYTIAKMPFFDLMHQQLLPVDGYLLNPFSTELFPIDTHLLSLLDAYHQNTLVN